MIELSLKIKNKNGETVIENTNTNVVTLAFFKSYSEGESIVLASSERNVYLMIQLDDAVNPSFVYLKENEFIFTIPFNEKKVAYSPKSFFGKAHLLTARTATNAEICSYKNLAKNEYDQHSDTGCYPHASANVETRGESVFAARNAIDGNIENHSHGGWPYESWGINCQDDAEIKIVFGREVEINSMVLYTRADFPHDNYWEKVTFTFSDDSKIISNLIKTADPQKIEFNKKTVEWVLLSNLIKSNDPSPFPALSQWEIYGNEVNK